MEMLESGRRGFVPERFERVGVEAISAVRDTVTHIEDERLDVLTASLDKSFHAPSGIKRAIVVKELIRSDSSKEFNLNLRVNGVNPNESSALLRNQAVFEIVESMIELPAKYLMPLGIIFSALQYDQFPESIRDKLSVYQADNNFSLRKSHKDWYLCDHLEPYLIDAVDRNDEVTVTDDNKTLLMMKFRGKMAGLCQESFISEKGKVFLEGNLYVPLGKGLREKLQTAHKKGLNKMVLTEGSWVFMRPLRGIAEEMMSAESVLGYAKGRR